MNYLLKLGNIVSLGLFCLIANAQSNFGDYVSSENIMTDDFSTNQAGWITAVSPDNCYSSKIEFGYLEITSTCKGIYPTIWMSPVIDVSRNFEIDAEILFVQGENNNALSLVWGKDDNYNRFAFGITGSGYYKISKFNSVWTNFKDWTAAEVFNRSDFNRLTVRKVDSKCYFFLNQKLVDITDFYSFFGNQIGFQDNQNTVMRVNSLKVMYIKPGPTLQNTNSGYQNTIRENPTISKKPVENPPNPSAGSTKITLRGFLGLSADYVLLTGNYDGTSYFSLPDQEIVLVPKLAASPGFGVQFGIRGKRMEFDWAYNLAMMKYTTSTEGFSGTSYNHLIRVLGFKAYVGKSYEKQLMPFIYFDWSLLTSHFSKLSYVAVGQTVTNTKSVNYNGMLIGLGAGLQYNTQKNLSFELKILPEYDFGTDLRSKGGTDYTIKSFKNFLLISSIGFNYYFHPMKLE
jgi:hypothetical protein